MAEFSLEELRVRVERLAQLIMDMDEDYTKLASRVSHLEGAISDVASLRDTVYRLSEIEANVARETVNRILSETNSAEVAEHLSKKVLVVRPATREELKKGDGVLTTR